VVVCGLVLLPAIVWSAAPRFLVPVSRGLPATVVVPKTYNFRFSLWDAATGGTQLWMEQRAYTIATRAVSHQRGSVSAGNPLNPADFSNQVYVQVEYYAGGRWVVVPGRSTFTFAAYSMYSANAGTPVQSCWDLNANALCDLDTEDSNVDGACDVLDCQGARGCPVNLDNRASRVRRGRTAHRVHRVPQGRSDQPAQRVTLAIRVRRVSLAQPARWARRALPVRRVPRELLHRPR
jgi:hypothetical protein